MAGDLRISLLLTADAAQAKGEVQGYKTLIDQLSTSTSDLATDTAAAAPAMGALGTQAQVAATGIDDMAMSGAEWASAVQIIRAAMNPMVAEHQQLQQAVRDVAAAEEMGAINAREAALAHDVLQRQMNEIDAAMAKAGTSIDGTTTALQRQETAVQQAIQRITGLSAASDESAASQIRHGAMLDDLRAKFDPLFAASRRYELELREIAEAERLGAISAMGAATARQQAAAALGPMNGQLRGVTASAGAANQATTQLGFQVNDIFMMATTGQAPLMTMMQQGSQVTQIFDGMKKSGMAIGPAVASSIRAIVSPMSLITLGAIGASAAIIQWLMSFKKEAPKAVDLMGELSKAVSAYTSAANAASAPTSELIAKYGDLSDVARRALEDIAAADRADAMSKVRAAVAGLTQQFGGLNDVVDDLGQTLSQGLSAQDFVRDFDMVPEAALALVNSIRSLNGAEGLDAQALAAQGIRDALIAAAGSAEAAAAGPFAALFREMANITQQSALMAAAEEARAAPAQKILADLEAENAMRLLILQHGAGSLEVTQARAAAEDKAREAAWDAAGASEDLKEQLRAANEQAEALGRQEMAAGIAGATAEARLLAATLGIALPIAIALANIGKPKPKPKLGFGLPSVAGPTQGDGPKLTFGDNPGSNNTYIPTIPKGLGSSGSGKGGGGGAAAAVTKERDALKDYLAEQQRQIDLLRELDPVQQEILRNHNALAGATSAEKDQVVDLINERQRLEEIRDQVAEIGNVGEQAFKGMLKGANSFSDALSMVLDKMADMVASSAWDALWGGGKSGGGGLGGWISGALGGFFGGGKSGGDLFANIGGAVKKADGGKIGGSGGPREDNIPIWASSGEFMINAHATAQHQPLLEAINGGASPRQIMAMASGARAYADGGMIGGAAPSAYRGGGAMFGAASAVAPAAAAGGGALAVRVFMDRGGEWQAEVQRIAGEIAVEMMQGGLEEFSRTAMPGRVAEINRQPWKRG